MNIRWLGHAAFELEADGTTVLIDPWLTGNPKAAASADELTRTRSCLTHGHGDHYGDLVSIAKRTGATVVAITEIAHELQEELGEDHPVFDPNMGGKVELDWGSVRDRPGLAHLDDAEGHRRAPRPGLLVELGGKRVYHLGDTCLFSDLQLVKRYGRIDVAIMPIGGHYTMDRFDAVVAAEWVGADTIIPCHYGTFPPIETDVEAFKSDVQNAGAGEVAILNPGDTHTA